MENLIRILSIIFTLLTMICFLAGAITGFIGVLHNKDWLMYFALRDILAGYVLEILTQFIERYGNFT